MATPRILPLQGIHNFRDYGGYAVAEGGRLKRGQLWRSAQHLDASDADLAAVDALGLADVIDFRGESERAAYPCRRGPGFAADVTTHEGETAALAPHVEAGAQHMDVATAHTRMEKLYAALPRRKPVLWVMRRYFEILAQGRGPSLVHCLAGKDRTGMAVALLHHAVGVHPDDAMEDFLLTNAAGDVEARIAAGGATIRAKWGDLGDDAIRVLMSVDARYLNAMRRSVAGQYGSIDRFLEDALGVGEETRAGLRLHLLDA